MNRLKDLRLEKHMTQQNVADLLGVQRVTYLKYESGDIILNSDALSKLTDLFGVSSDYILMLSDVRTNADATDEDGVYALREEIRRRPEMKDLFDAARKVSDDDLRRAVKIIEALSK